MDDALVDTITTDRNGRAYLALEDGSYYAVEIEANPDFRLDDTPHYFEVKNGEVTTLRISKVVSGIRSEVLLALTLMISTPPTALL